MSLLSVTVKKARYAGIQAQQYNSYVTLKLQNVKSTTVTVKGPNPCWEQDFLFETNDVNTGLLIEVWSKGMIWDRALGYNYIPLRDIQYSNEEGTGQWVSLDAELVMRDGEVVGTKNPTGDSLLVDCRFELPFGRYDPPSGWKCLLEPDTERRSGPRSLGDEDNTDWLPLGRHNLPDQWSGRDAENTAGDALQRKLERLNSTILGHDDQTRRQQYYGHSGYSEDSDYTSDLNYPIGQHPNSSASQFRTAAQLMRTPDRSLETSRENSYERDDAPAQSHLQGSHHLPINHFNQQGRGTQNYKTQQGYRNYNDTDGEPLYYNSRPRDYKEYSSQGWYSNQYSGCGQNYGQTDLTNRKRGGGRRPSLERQTTLYDDQYYSDQQYYDGTDKQQYQNYSAHNYGLYYNQNYGYQNERYGEEEEDKQWDSGGYYFPDNYAISSTDNYQNIINKKRSSKTLPTTVYSNSSQDNAYYTPTKGMSYDNTSLDHNTTMNATTRRKLLKQQRQSSDNYNSTSWQSDDKNSVWQSAEDYNYYNDYNSINTTTNAVPIAVTPSHPPKKRALPQIRTPSRCKGSAVSLPQTPVRQLPNPLAAINKQRVSAPVSRTTSDDYDQNGGDDMGILNENYNYGYVSSDNLQNDKFGVYPTEIRTSANYPANYDNSEMYVNNYQNKENYPDLGVNYTAAKENHQNTTRLGNIYSTAQTQGVCYPVEYYQEDNLKSYYETDVTEGLTQKKFLEMRSNSPFTQQNTDSLESRDDELRDESFETAVDSICSSVPVQKQPTEYFSIDTTTEYKPEPPKPPEQQSTGMLGGLFDQLTRSPSHLFQQQQQQQQQHAHQEQPQAQKPEQRSRDQTNLLTNPALAAMNVTKGFFSSITNAVNNTVQNINKQQQQQQQQQQQHQQQQQQQQKAQQQVENQVQRIQITKRGSLKQQDTIESHPTFKTRQNSFDSQIHDYMIPEEPAEYYEEKEEEYYEQRSDDYEYDEKEYYEGEENDYAKEKEPPLINNVSYLNQRNESESLSAAKRNNLRHQDTIESEKRFETNNRNYLRQQDSLDSCAEELVMHNSHHESPTIADRFEETRTGSVELLRNGSLETNHLETPRKRGSGHDNSLIEPYHSNWTGSEVQKGYSPSPPIIQKQQSVDLEGIEEEVGEEPSALPEEIQKPPSFEPVPEEPVKVVIPERRKMTAKERWHRAYNVVVQQLNIMDELQNSDPQHTTEWALLFPLRTGLFSVKSSFNSLTDSDTHSEIDRIYRAEYSSQQNITRRKMVSENSSPCSSIENLHYSPKLRIRRRSSMSDLDKIGGLKANVSDIVRSATSHSYDHPYNSTPNSPHAHYMRQMQKSENVRGSIGDFMNFKRFGGSAGLRTETIIAKTVPLTTVTKRSKSRELDMGLENDEDSFRSSRNSFRGSRSSFNDSKTSLESVDSFVKASRTRKCGVAFSKNIIMQHYGKNSNSLGCSNERSVMEESEDDLGGLTETYSVNGFQDLENSLSNGLCKNPEAPLSGSQRTERLSRIIRQQHSTHQLYANIYVSRGNVCHGCCF